MKLLFDQMFSGKREALWLSAFLSSVFAPLWGVGYVVPFLLVFIFLLPRELSQLKIATLARKSGAISFFTVFALFLLLVLASSLLHPESKWGSTEGFWVVLAAFLYFFFGFVVGGKTGEKKAVLFLKLFFFIAFLALIVTIFYRKSYLGGIWKEMNNLTTAVLMMTGGISGLFFGDMRKMKDLKWIIPLLPLIVFAFYFSSRLSSSDAAVILLVGAFFLMAILTPEWHTFVFLWSFFLLILCAGIAYLILNDPIDFKSLLNTKRFESFLSFRPQGWLASLSLVRDNPWTGIGAGLYRQFYEALLSLIPGQPVILAHSHSIYFVHFVAHGVFTGLAFISLIALNLRLIFSSLKRRELAPFGLMAAGIWFFAFTYGLVELTPASRELVPLLWGSAGMLTGFYSNHGENDRFHPADEESVNELEITSEIKP